MEQDWKRLTGDAILFFLFIMLIAGCGSSSESSKTDTAPPTMSTKEMLYHSGHRFYLQQNLDSAKALLVKALAIDANYREALAVLAPLHFELAGRGDAGRRKAELLRQAQTYYVKLESLGGGDSELYERLCEISSTLRDDKTFLRYAKKNAELYPFDRQHYNLSVAYFSTEEYNNVITVCKQATEKFKQSPFIGTFYRQLGRAYMKVDRDQTAEKTFYTGLGVIDKKMSELRKADPGYASNVDYMRLKDDKTGILTSLKYLHTTYKAADKLADVEKKLKELGK